MCRKSAEQGLLLRFVAATSAEEGAEKSGSAEGQLLLDLSGLEPGRGAYCHPRRSCFLDARLLPLLRASLGRLKSSRIARKARHDEKGFARLKSMLVESVARERDARGMRCLETERNERREKASPLEEKSFELVRLSRTERVSVLHGMLRGFLEESERGDGSPKSKILLRL